MEYLTIQEYAEKMRVSDRTVRRWIKQGIINVVQVGAIIRIPENEVPHQKEQKPKERGSESFDATPAPLHLVA